MCGIAGIVGRGSEELIKKMGEVLSHRGPDDWGYYSLASLKKNGIFNVDKVHKMLEDHLAQREYNLALLWAVFTFQVWHELFVQRQTQ